MDTVSTVLALLFLFLLFFVFARSSGIKGSSYIEKANTLLLTFRAANIMVATVWFPALVFHSFGDRW